MPRKPTLSLQLSIALEKLLPYAEQERDTVYDLQKEDDAYKKSYRDCQRAINTARKALLRATYAGHPLTKWNKP